MVSKLTLVVAIVILTASSQAVAQDQPPVVGADVFAGGVPDPSKDEENSVERDLAGWQLGASLRAGRKLQWLGWTGTYGRYSNDDVHVSEVLAGVRVTTPFTMSGDYAVRLFAHALGGSMSSTAQAGVRDRGPSFVLGGGVDMLFFRIQLDWVHASVAGVLSNAPRAFVGGVVPLCFSGCRPDSQDGFPVTGRR